MRGSQVKNEKGSSIYKIDNSDQKNKKDKFTKSTLMVVGSFIAFFTIVALGVIIYNGINGFVKFEELNF